MLANKVGELLGPLRRNVRTQIFFFLLIASYGVATGFLEISSRFLKVYVFGLFLV